jgi:RND superfamily putative drug exporter
MLNQHHAPEIGIEELEDLTGAGKVYLLDVREDWEYKRGRVPGAISIPLGQLTAKAAGLPKDKPYAVICQSGVRSLSGADYLLSQGFEGAVSVKGGTGAWATSNRPIEKD